MDTHPATVEDCPVSHLTTRLRQLSETAPLFAVDTYSHGLAEHGTHVFLNLVFAVERPYGDAHGIAYIPCSNQVVACNHPCLLWQRPEVFALRWHNAGNIFGNKYAVTVHRVIDLAPRKSYAFACFVGHLNIEVYNWRKLSLVLFLQDNFVKYIIKGVSVIAICSDETYSAVCQSCLFYHYTVQRQFVKIDCHLLFHLTCHKDFFASFQGVCRCIVIEIVCLSGE